MKKVILTLISLFCIGGSLLHAQELDAGKIRDLHQWTFRMSQGGDSLGYSKFEVRRIGSQILVSEDAHVPSFKEDMFLYLNGETLAPDSIMVTGRLSGFPIESKAKFANDAITGYGNFPKHPSKPTINLSQPFPADTKVRLASFVLSPFYKDLKEGMSFSYPQFSTLDGQIRKIEAKVTATEKLMVLGEEVEALKLELSGGVAEQNLYIDTKRSRIVKISFRNIDWIYTLISD